MSKSNCHIRGHKNDCGKPMWDLLPFSSLKEVVEVLTLGAKKYSPHNWMRVPNPKSRYFSALMRHLVAWKRGERTDPETGLSHLAHAGCCLLFLIWHDKPRITYIYTEENTNE